ncbi:MAG: hypothetical protein NT150_15190 [Bacteroidetes bacterium]|nr:hypothetical protein [Bacteroidota bacterium]
MKIVVDASGAISIDKNSVFKNYQFEVKDASVLVFGGLNEKMFGAFKQFFAAHFNNMSLATFVNKLYKSLPSHFYFIIRNNDALFVVTDPYAALKLYAYQSREKLVISDNYKDFKAECKEFTVNKNAVKLFMLNNYTPSKHTLFNEISKFEPASIYEVKGTFYSLSTYMQIDASRRIDGEDFVDEFYNTLKESFSTYFENYDHYSLYLSGGMDSSFLLKFLMANGADRSKLDTVTEIIGGLKKDKMIDNDYDLYYSEKLAAEEKITHKKLNYDYSSDQIMRDFVELKDFLFNEYAPAIAFGPVASQIEKDNLIISGQNADSVLSFGAAGFPMRKGLKITGLGGLFARNFQFSYKDNPNFIQNFLSNWLMKIYYKKNYNISSNIFSDKDYLLGLAMEMKNMPFWENDPGYRSVTEIRQLADWMYDEYIQPILSKWPGLSFHGYFQLIYQHTYMQGSANRSTINLPLIYGRNVYLPYTHLSVLENLVMLKPNWKYWFYAKYPNIKLSRTKLNMPDYIINRSDPNDSSSTTFLYNAWLSNRKFYDYLMDNLSQTKWEIYEGIISQEVLNDFKNMSKNIQANRLPFLMKFIWMDSIIREFTSQKS